jgi:Glyoxalase/Bleomycin resistance protein/Dioxygenase superfamily
LTTGGSAAAGSPSTTRPTTSPAARSPAAGGGRLHHVAYATDQREDILRAADIFLENGVHIETGPHKHAIQGTFFLYVWEPAGNRIELANSGARLILAPDWEPVVWTEADRRKGQALGAEDHRDLPHPRHAAGREAGSLSHGRRRSEPHARGSGGDRPPRPGRRGNRARGTSASRHARELPAADLCGRSGGGVGHHDLGPAGRQLDGPCRSRAAGGGRPPGARPDLSLRQGLFRRPPRHLGHGARLPGAATPGCATCAI